MTILPYSQLTFVIAFSSNPRSPLIFWERLTFLLFLGAEIPSMLYHWRVGNKSRASTLLPIIILWTTVFHFAKRVRKKFATLSDAHLSKFLLETVLGGSIKSVTAMMFVTFRSLNCVAENSSFEDCARGEILRPHTLNPAVICIPSSHQPFATRFAHRRSCVFHVHLSVHGRLLDHQIVLRGND